MIITSSPTSMRPRRFSRRKLWSGMALVVLFGALCTAYAGMSVVRVPAVYWSSLQVRFLAPTSPANPNTLQLSIGTVVMTANAVLQMIDDSNRPQPSSPEVTIVDEGIRDGWSVTLPNSGGQYQTYFVEPYLIVQAAGPDPEVVRTRVLRLVRLIDDDLAVLQTAQHVSPYVRIHTALSVTTPHIFEVRGSRARAAAGCLVLGIVGTATMLWLFRLAVRRRTVCINRDSII